MWYNTCSIKFKLFQKFKTKHLTLKGQRFTVSEDHPLNIQKIVWLDIFSMNSTMRFKVKVAFWI